MTLFTRGVPMLFGRQAVPIQLVNQVSRASSASPITFADLPYGAYPSSGRLCIVGLSSQDSGNISSLSHESVTWGGLAFSRRTPVTDVLVSGSSITVSIWSRFVPSGATGDLVIGHNKSICDSMGVATFVTNLSDDAVPVDADGGEAIGDLNDTVFDIATVAGGFVVAIGTLAVASGNHTGLSGNAGTGAVPELFDLSIEGDHRMSAWLKAGTPGGSTEDFTISHDTGSSFNVWAIASWAGGT